MRIAFSNFFAKDRNLRVLAAEAENGGARDVRMMDVAGDEAAEIVGVFASATAAAFVQEEADAVDVFENFAAGGSGGRVREGGRGDFKRLPFLIQANEFGNLAAINLWSGEAELLFKGLFENADVAVFAEK